MAEVMTTWGLDYSGVTRGTRDVAAQMNRAAAEADRKWKQTQKSVLDVGKAILGAGLAGAAIRAGSAALDEYRAKFGEAGDEALRLGDAVEKMKIGIGRDLNGALASSGGDLAAWIDALEGARGAVVNFLAGDSGGSIDAARKAEEEAIGRGKAVMARRGTRFDIERERAGSGSPFAGFDQRGVEEARRHAEAVTKIGGEANAETRDQLLADENELHRLKMQNLARERADKAQDLEKERVLFDLREREVQIAQLRAQNKQREAIWAQATLDVDREIAEIEARRDLSAEEKSRRRTAAQFRGVQQGEAALADFDRERAKARRDEMESVQSENAKQRVQRLQIENKKTEADLLAMELDTRERILAIQKSELLTAEEKAKLIRETREQGDLTQKAFARDALREARDDRRTALRSRPVRSLAAGLGGDAFVRAAAFGPAGSAASVSQSEMRELKRIANSQEAAVKVLQRIESRGGGLQ